jgi:hypothetical protein
MQPVCAVHPKLDVLGGNAEALPVGWAGDLVGVLHFELAHLFFESTAAGEGAALPGDGGADLAAPGAAVEVGVYIVGGKLGDLAFDAQLPSQRFPVEAECGFGVVGELGAFAALGVGEEAEATLVDALDQHHADAGSAVCRCCRESGGIGVVGLAGFGLFEPELAGRDGVLREISVEQGHGTMLSGRATGHNGLQWPGERGLQNGLHG